ncbi:MAG TPA: hypothetical protein EYP22_09950 [Methanosarcinales archaeon]|nr:hypothetical protein [Methanosarcinales archaeon]
MTVIPKKSNLNESIVTKNNLLEIRKRIIAKIGIGEKIDFGVVHNLITPKICFMFIYHQLVLIQCF